MKNDIFDLEIDELITNIESSLRSTTIEQIRDRFVPPDYESLKQVMNTANHIVFGRRGSGKSSLLLKARDELNKNGNITIYLDANLFFTNNFPDILIQMLIVSIDQAIKYIEESIWFYKPFKRIKILKNAKKNKKDLETILNLYDNAEVRITDGDKRLAENFINSELGSGLTTENNFIGSVKINSSSKKTYQESTDTQQGFIRDKMYELNKKIYIFGQFFSDLVEFTENDLYIFIDDFYFINPEIQTKLLTFIHQISKGRKVWLKIGTIRFRSRWYSRDSGDFYGLKLGDDALEINLDKTLESLDQTKYFQKEVLDQFDLSQGEYKPSDLMNTNARERLVLASGGVMRDYLRLYVDSIRLARKRINANRNDHLGKLISVVDVNNAASVIGDNKLDEIPNTDPQANISEVRKSFDQIKTFCFTNGHNYFLIDRDDQKLILDVGELMDLRLIHLIKSSISVSDKSGINYSGYILDVSQYVGRRKRRGFTEIDLYSQNRYDFRRKKSIYKAENQN